MSSRLNSYSMNRPDDDIIRWIEEAKKYGTPRHKLAKKFVFVTADPHMLNIIQDQDG